MEIWGAAPERKRLCFMSAVVVKSRTGTQWDEMLWALHRAVCLLLIPHPPKYGPLKFPWPVASVFALPLAHNNPTIWSGTIWSKRQVNILPGCLAAITALLPSHLLPCFPPTEGSACQPPSFSPGQVDCTPLADEPWLTWLLFCSSVVFTCLFHPLENEFLQGRTRTLMIYILRA